MNSAAEIRKRTYKVKIFHQAYTISSSASEAEFQQIADHVDHLMQTISSRSGSTDGTRAAVMAAMHLADKLRQAERRLESIHADQMRAIEQVDERTGDLERLLRETLAMEEEPSLAFRIEAATLEAPEAEPLVDEIPDTAAENPEDEAALWPREAQSDWNPAPLAVAAEPALEETPIEFPPGEEGRAPSELSPAEATGEEPGPVAAPARIRSRRERAAAPTLFAMGDEAEATDSGEGVPF